MLESKKENYFINPKYSAVFFSVGVILILIMSVLIGIPIPTLSESQQDNGKDQPLVEENSTIQKESRPIDQMNCTELNQFIVSFEKGWGSAIPLYNEKCS